MSASDNIIGQSPYHSAIGSLQLYQHVPKGHAFDYFTFVNSCVPLAYMFSWRSARLIFLLSLLRRFDGLFTCATSVLTGPSLSCSLRNLYTRRC